MDHQRYSRPKGTGKQAAKEDDQESREQSRDSVLKGTKRSGVTKTDCWKSWGKMTKAVIWHSSECQKRRVFLGGVDFDGKGGVGGGGVSEKCKISRKNAFQSGQKRSI